MKKTLSLCMAVAVTICANAQILTVNSIEKVPIPDGSDAKATAISPQADYVLFTTGDNTGLKKVDLATGEITVITQAKNAGFRPQISPDGKTVVFREKTVDKKKLSYNTLRSHDISNGKEKTIVKASRDLQGYAFDGNMATAINKGKMKSKAFGKKNDITKPVLSIENRHLMITRNGKTETFDPNGPKLSYLWPSISPDGSKVLYYVGADGAYVCNIDGSNINRIGELRAPMWLDDSTIVGMNDHDNGMFVTSSSIVVANLNGEQQTLTPEGIIAMYPQPAQNKIAFSTEDGELYIIQFTK